jgi:hypothetical protein
MAPQVHPGLSVVGRIRHARWRRGGKPLGQLISTQLISTQPFFDRHDRLRLDRVEAREIVPVDSILAAKSIKIIVRK